MQRIALTKAEPGMTLAQAVSQQGGPVLVGEGVVLTDAIIDRIRQIGVSVVCVEGTLLAGKIPKGICRLSRKICRFCSAVIKTMFL
jgi:hypothetical protein